MKHELVTNRYVLIGLDPALLFLLVAVLIVWSAVRHPLSVTVIEYRYIKKVTRLE